MGFLALIIALLIEQARPLPVNNLVHRAIGEAADLLMGVTNAGERRHGAAGWLALVVAVLLIIGLLQWLLAKVHPLAVLGLHVAVLYYTVGFRQFSHAFTEIQLLLASGDIAAARRVLGDWLRTEDPEFSAQDASVTEICRVTVANALVASHRHVFGPIFWYVILPGPIGPVLYRLAEMLARRWSDPQEVYGRFAQTAYRLVDWLPIRMTVAGFAIVGSFEDAVYAWRGAVAAGTADDQRALLLAAGGGALGMRIADPALEARWAQDSEQGYEPQGAEPGVDGLRSAVGLVWRSVVLWVSLYAMLTIATWLGR